VNKILIVDDQPEVRELVEITLRSKNFQILQAMNGENAINIARKEKPDLIIMDIMMPGKIDGIEATRILKNDPETKEILIIILTAKGQAGDVEKGYKAGADDYFIKPFSPLDLIKKIDEVFET